MFLLGSFTAVGFAFTPMAESGLICRNVERTVHSAFITELINEMHLAGSLLFLSQMSFSKQKGHVNNLFK